MRENRHWKATNPAERVIMTWQGERKRKPAPIQIMQVTGSSLYRSIEEGGFVGEIMHTQVDGGETGLDPTGGGE